MYATKITPARDFQMFVELSRRSNELHAVVEQEHRAKAHVTLLQTNNSHKLWSTLKGAVFGAHSSIPPLVGNGGALVSDSVGKADLFFETF